MSGNRARRNRRHRHAVAQLAGALQIGVAPGGQFRLVAQLLQCVRAQLARLPVVGLRKHDLAHGVRHPAVFALGEILARPRDRRGRAAHVGDRLLRALHGRQRIEVGGVGVVPAEIPLIHGLGVVAERAVVAAHVPLFLEAPGQREPLGDFAGLEAVAHQPQRLVVQVLVGVALLGQVVEHAAVAPHRPVMLGEHHVGLHGEPSGRSRWTVNLSACV